MRYNLLIFREAQLSSLEIDQVYYLHHPEGRRGRPSLNIEIKTQSDMRKHRYLKTIVRRRLKGRICHFVKWQIRLFSLRGLGGMIAGTYPVSVGQPGVTAGGPA